MSVTQPRRPTDTAHLPTQHAVHMRMRELYAAAGLRTRTERLDFVSAVVGRPIVWAHQLSPAECRLVIEALHNAITEPTHEEAP